MSAAVRAVAVLLVLAGTGNSRAINVAPLVGDWQYSHVRCNETIYGFTDPMEAQANGMLYHYNACGDAKLESQGSWGTTAEPQFGACGSTKRYPRVKMGIEYINVRHPRVQYCHPHVVDSFALYRERSVLCPAGYKAAGNVCTPIEELQPEKNAGPECPSNGSNPINGATGNKYQRETDLATMPGGLEFIRHYNSYQALPARLTEPGLPLNWRHNYSRAVMLRVGMVTTAMVSRPDGRAWSFTLGEDGIWQSDEDVPGELTAQREGDDIVGWVYRNKNNETEYYNGDGRMQRIVSPEGLSLTLSYQDDRLTTVADRHNHQLQFHYYPQGHEHEGLLAELIGADNVRWQYHYDEHANLTGVQYPGSSAQQSLRHYHYNEAAHTQSADLPNALTGITLETGRRYATYQYDIEGRAVSSEHGSMQANRTRIDYHSDGSRTITDALGKERQYDYENHLGVARVTDISAPCTQCGAQGEQRRYDIFGRVTSQTDFRGYETRYRYQDFARPDLETLRIEAVGTAQQRTVSTSWNSQWRLPAERAEPQLFTRWHYQGDSEVDCGGSAGALCRQEQWSTDDLDGSQGLDVTLAGSPRVTSWQYVPASSISAAAGLLASMDGPRDDVVDVTHYEYDHDSGYLIATTNALGHRTHYEDHDGWGRPRRIIDANGMVTEQQYHPRGWLLRRVVNGAVTTLDYDEAGQLIAVRDPEGGETHFDYDDATRLVSIRDDQGNRIRYTLNALGEREQEFIEDASGKLLSSLTREFDQLNRLSSLTDGEGGVTQYDYDAAGNLIRQQSPEERVTQYQYDPMNRVMRIIDALQAETSFSHDGAGRTSLVRDANLAETAYQYDGFGNLLSQLSPDTGETLHQYDAAGNRLRTTDARGVAVVYQYDALNRLTSLQYPDSVHDAYLVHDQSANGIGRLSSIEEIGQVLRFDYDRRGNVAGQRVETDQTTFSVGYQHDLVDRLISMEYPSGARVMYQRNGLGQIVSMSTRLANSRDITIATNMRYQGFGGLLQLIHGNGIVLSRDYDLADRLIRHTEEPVLDLGFAYDGDGNLLSRSDSSERFENYQYDPLNRLVAAQGGFGSRSYDYDAVGNRQQLSIQATGGAASSSTTYIYQDASNRLLQAAGRVYEYDAAGNPLKVGDLHHDYDDRGRLQAISRNGQLIAQYRYNLLGQRTVKIVQGDGAATAEWHRAQAAQAQAEAAAISGQLLALDIEYASEQAERQSALNLAAQYQLAADQSQQTAATLEQQSAEQLLLAEQSHMAAAEQQRLSSEALASRSDSWLGWLINWWYELRSDGYLAEAERLNAQAVSYEAEAALLQQQSEAARQQSEQHLEATDMQFHFAEESLAAMADIDNARQQKQVALSEAIALADYHLDQADQPQAEEQVLRFVYNQNGQLIGEYHSDGTPVREYIYRDMTPAALLDYQQSPEEPQVYWYHTDQLGTPQVVTNEHGDIVWQALFSPFGKTEVQVSLIAQPLRFPGQYFDEESGLHYNYFRYYDPVLGRYLRSDPIGLGGGLNTYAYVDGNPLRKIDLRGLYSSDCLAQAKNRLLQCLSIARSLYNRMSDNFDESCDYICSDLGDEYGGYISCRVVCGSSFGPSSALVYLQYMGMVAGCYGVYEAQKLLCRDC
ncbi:MAG: RHS domain-containing protein [Alcanivoracaceae bacterium]|nr:RHS domain-containing protein [Alcanivoracaceae bacterium]